MLSGKAFSVLLRLYPPEFREQFGAEMTTVFRNAAENQRGLAYTGFVLRELFGLTAGAARQRLSPAPSQELAFPCDAHSAERYIAIVSRRVIYAIANHDFEGARFYDAQERRARYFLELLRSGAG